MSYIDDLRSALNGIDDELPFLWDNDFTDSAFYIFLFETQCVMS